MNALKEFYWATGEDGFLSNLYLCVIHFEGREFRSAEDAYQFGKPKDLAVAEWLIAAPQPYLVAVGMPRSDSASRVQTCND